MNIQCDNVIVERRSDIVIVNKMEKTAIIIDVAVPGDKRVIEKEKEKIEKHQSLKREIQRLRNLKKIDMVNMEASVVEFIFCKTPCFQHILMNDFRLMRLKYERFSLRRISDISDIQTTFTLQKFYCKNSQCKYIKNENHKSHLSNKNKKQ